MKKFLTLILFVVSFLMEAQNEKYFIRNYGWLDIHSGRDVQYLGEGLYWLCGAFADSPITRSHSYCFHFDEYGDTINFQTYSIDDYGTITESSIKTKNGYIAVGSMQSLINQKINSFLIETNNHFELQSFSKLGSEQYDNNVKSIVRASGGYLLAGRIWSDQVNEDSFFTNPYLIKIDSMGNQLWDKIYSYPYYSWFREIHVSPKGDGYYLIGTIEYIAGGGEILLLKIDEEGEVIWERTFNLGYEDFGLVLTFTRDGGYLLTGDSGLAGDYGTIIKLNEHTFERWRKDDELFYFGSISGIVELADSTIIVSGNPSDYYLSGETSTDFEVMIAKLSAEGETLWARHYGGERNDLAYDLVLANGREDGLDGFVISGRTESLSEPGANVYLVKTNCMGLLTEPLASFSAAQDSEHELTYHFTNYSEFVYPDSIDGGHFIWNFGDGTTSNELHPSHEYADKGLSYVVTLTAVVCSDTSRWEMKVVAGDEIVNIEELEVEFPAFSFKLYPNPAIGGELVLEYDLPKEGVLELFDLQGRRVMVDVLVANERKNQTFSVGYSVFDIRYLESGMYLYRLSVEGRTLEDGKLVVE